jgi:pyridoxine 5'-phosphate synthase PdxJ
MQQEVIGLKDRKPHKATGVPRDPTNTLPITTEQGDRIRQDEVNLSGAVSQLGLTDSCRTFCAFFSSSLEQLAR